MCVQESVIENRILTIANLNMWVFFESSSVFMVDMAVLWEALGATPSPVLMQQTATLTESLRNGMRDRLWLNVCGWVCMNVSVGRETLFTVIFQGCVCNTSVLTYNVVFTCIGVRLVQWREWVRKAERRDETTHFCLVKRQPLMAASEILCLQQFLMTLS